MEELLFPSHLWHFQHPNPQVCGLLAEHVLALERQDPVGLEVTNQGGWHSSTNLLQDPVLADLLYWIAACCQGAVHDWGWDLDKATPTFNNAWAMVNRAGHSTRAHLHPNSVFSGVVYLQVPVRLSFSIPGREPRCWCRLREPVVLRIARAGSDACPRSASCCSFLPGSGMRWSPARRRNRALPSASTSVCDQKLWPDRPGSISRGC